MFSVTHPWKPEVPETGQLYVYFAFLRHQSTTMHKLLEIMAILNLLVLCTIII